MVRYGMIVGLLISGLMASHFCFAQDVLAEAKIMALKELPPIAIVVRPDTPKEFATPKEWADMVTVQLAKGAPNIKVSQDVNSAGVAWLEIDVMTSEQGAIMKLTLYRWVRIADSGQKVFAPVWNDVRGEFGFVTLAGLRDDLHSLVAGFIADYLRQTRH